jgi:tRNA U34 5-carboxymethylaminomethyl modifying GTPase MnmE/TrmE
MAVSVAVRAVVSGDRLLKLARQTVALVGNLHSSTTSSFATQGSSPAFEEERRKHHKQRQAGQQQEHRQQQQQQPRPEGQCRLIVAVVGLPNAGKSTLTNRLIGHKISGVSSKRNTTIDPQLGSFTVGNSQVRVLLQVCTWLVLPAGAMKAQQPADAATGQL